MLPDLEVTWSSRHVSKDGSVRPKFLILIQWRVSEL
jgi:hypothetical protein